MYLNQKSAVISHIHVTFLIDRSDVVRCLSDIVRNDTLLGEEHRLTRSCRKQLRFELLQQVC